MHKLHCRLGMQGAYSFNALETVKGDQAPSYLYIQKSKKMKNHFHADETHVLQIAAVVTAISFNQVLPNDFL